MPGLVPGLVCSALSLRAGCGPQATTPNLAWPEVALVPQDRILILAPHPDDESLACGGIIQRAVAMDLPLRVAFLTYGDNNEWSFALYREHPVLAPQAMQGMGLVRHDEALAATRILGLQPDQLTFLGYPDFGTLSIWYTHWGNRLPFRSMLTRVTAVPYANAFRPGAAYKGEEILQDLTAVLREFRPTKVFLSHPADHNPDHLALYLFIRVALWDLDAEMRPALYPFLVHYPHWPEPRGYHPADLWEPPAVLDRTVSWQVYPLSRDATEHKLAALRAHRTQYRSNGTLLASFARANELFSDFPAVELSTRASGVALPSDGIGNSGPAEQLTEAEQATFVGVEWRTVRLEGQDVVISLDFSRPLAHGVRASVYIFGYRADRPFADLPKLHARFGEGSQALYDQERRLPQDALQVNRQSRGLTLRVPLTLLGDPQRVLVSARTYLGEIPLDWVSWRILELPASR